MGHALDQLQTVFTLRLYVAILAQSLLKLAQSFSIEKKRVFNFYSQVVSLKLDSKHPVSNVTVNNSALKKKILTWSVKPIIIIKNLL